MEKIISRIEKLAGYGTVYYKTPEQQKELEQKHEYDDYPPSIKPHPNPQGSSIEPIYNAVEKEYEQLHGNYPFPTPAEPVIHVGNKNNLHFYKVHVRGNRDSNMRNLRFVFYTPGNNPRNLRPLDWGGVPAERSATIETAERKVKEFIKRNERDI